MFPLYKFIKIVQCELFSHGNNGVFLWGMKWKYCCFFYNVCGPSLCYSTSFFLSPLIFFPSRVTSSEKTLNVNAKFHHYRCCVFWDLIWITLSDDFLLFLISMIRFLLHSLVSWQLTRKQIQMGLNHLNQVIVRLSPSIRWAHQCSESKKTASVLEDVKSSVQSVEQRKGLCCWITDIASVKTGIHCILLCD